MARQYNLKNLNGIHLKAPYDYTSYSTNDVNALIQDYDFHPYRSNDLSDFEFINGSYNLVDNTSIYNNKPMGNGFIGNNSKATRSIAVDYTQFKKNNTLVKGEVYYTSFDMYFNFNGDGENYIVNSTGYTINVNIYAIIGNNKKKLKLSDLKVYDYKSATYSGSTSNPVIGGYKNISTSFFNNWVNITGDTTLHVSYLPVPHRYDVQKTSGLASYTTITYIEGNIAYPNYGNYVNMDIYTVGGIYNITSFNNPVIPTITVTDGGVAEAPSNLSPFNVMSGYMFKVTAELDASTEELFNSNICTGNKNFKIMVDYNGRISQTTVGYVIEQNDVSTVPGGGPLPA